MDRKSSRASRSPELQHDGPPVYQQIADRIREEITAGRLAPGDRVDGENDLMRRYGVARGTVREALAILRHAGLIETVRGLGTFVRKTELIPRYGSPQVSGYTRPGTEQELTIDSLRVEHGVADEHIATLLGIKPGAGVVIRRRRYLLEDRPVQLATSYTPAEIAASASITHSGLEQEELDLRLSELERRSIRFIEDLRARMPSPDEVKRLHLVPGAPVVTITRTGLTEDNRPVNVDEFTFDATVYHFLYEVSS